MRYLGGKSKIAKRLAAIIGTGEEFLEPFMGGGAMTAALAPNFSYGRASDIHPDLIMLWQALSSGWIPPSRISEEEYYAIKESPPSALRGFCGFGPSWGGKFFGGYARGGNRNYAYETKKSLLRDIELMKNVSFSCIDYRLLSPSQNCVVYADPPYAETTGYSDSFNST